MSVICCLVHSLAIPHALAVHRTYERKCTIHKYIVQGEAFPKRSWVAGWVFQRYRLEIMVGVGQLKDLLELGSGCIRSFVFPVTDGLLQNGC